MPYKPYESDGLNCNALIWEIGNNPPFVAQQPVQHNIVKALWNLRSLVDREIERVRNKVVNTSTSIAANDHDVIVIENLTSDIDITLPEWGDLYIKRLDDSNYVVTIVGTVDNVVDVTLDMPDGIHLIGANSKFYLV